MSELTELRDRLKAALSGSHTDSDDEAGGPDTDGMAQKIKALKAANTIEATPPRPRQKQASAEEPVTARIRRRQEANAEASEAVQRGQPEAANDNHHADNDNQPTNGSAKPTSFRERIEKERQQRSEGNSPA